MAIPLLVFWGTSVLFPKVAVSVCIPTSSVRGLSFHHILTNTCYLVEASFADLHFKEHLYYESKSMYIHLFCAIQRLRDYCEH